MRKQTKRNETKLNETKRNETKRNETKRNATNKNAQTNNQTMQHNAHTNVHKPQRKNLKCRNCREKCVPGGSNYT